MNPREQHPTKKTVSPPATVGTAVFMMLLLTLLTVTVATTSFAVELQRFARIIEERFGAPALTLATDWQDLLAQSSQLPIASKLAVSNAFFNERVQWRADTSIYGVEDYWATPLETLGHQAADCEDFTIAKYVTLLLLGVPKESLRLVYVKATLPGNRSQAHMVLAWYETPEAVPLILDNINYSVMLASERPDLQPVFSFNADTLWIGASRQAGDARPQARISRWQQVLERMAQEGLDALW